MSTQNDNPTVNKDTVYASWIFDIVEKTDNNMLVEQRQGDALGAATYLGCIVSADRQTVYWVNETQPLP